MNAPMAIAIALPPERLLEPDVLAVAVLITGRRWALVVVGIAPGEVSPPPSDPPPDGDGDGGTDVAAVAVAPPR